MKLYATMENFGVFDDGFIINVLTRVIIIFSQRGLCLYWCNHHTKFKEANLRITHMHLLWPLFYLGNERINRKVCGKTGLERNWAILEGILFIPWSWVFNKICLTSFWVPNVRVAVLSSQCAGLQTWEIMVHVQTSLPVLVVFTRIIRNQFTSNAGWIKLRNVMSQKFIG